MLACDVIQASARMLSKHVAVTLKKHLCLLKIVMTNKVSLVFVNLHYAILRYINIYRLKMDRDSLLDGALSLCCVRFGVESILIF